MIMKLTHRSKRLSKQRGFGDYCDYCGYLIRLVCAYGVLLQGCIPMHSGAQLAGTYILKVDHQQIVLEFS